MADTLNQLLDWLDEYTNQYELPFSLVRAIVKVESNDDIYAYRVEPAYRYLVNIHSHRPFRSLTREEGRSERAPSDFPYWPRISSRDTEWWGQQASWGPMQIMGAVAREYGFTESFPALCGPLGVKYGCHHLHHLRLRFHVNHGWDGVAAAYNAGSPRYTLAGDFENQIYVDKVARHGGFADGI